MIERPGEVTEFVSEDAEKRCRAQRPARQGLAVEHDEPFSEFRRIRQIIKLQKAEKPEDAAAARDRAVAIKDDRVLKGRVAVADEFAGVLPVHVYQIACSRIDNAARVDKFDAGCRNVRVELKDSIN